MICPMCDTDQYLQSYGNSLGGMGGTFCEVYKGGCGLGISIRPTMKETPYFWRGGCYTLEDILRFKKLRSFE